MCHIVAALQPKDCVVVDESLTSGASYWDHSATCERFSHLTLTGGAIGFVLSRFAATFWDATWVVADTVEAGGVTLTMRQMADADRRKEAEAHCCHAARRRCATRSVCPAAASGGCWGAAARQRARARAHLAA